MAGALFMRVSKLSPSLVESWLWSSPPSVGRSTLPYCAIMRTTGWLVATRLHLALACVRLSSEVVLQTVNEVLLLQVRIVTISRSRFTECR